MTAIQTRIKKLEAATGQKPAKRMAAYYAKCEVIDNQIRAKLEALANGQELPAVEVSEAGDEARAEILRRLARLAAAGQA